MVGVWEGLNLGSIPNDHMPSQTDPKISIERRCSTILPNTAELNFVSDYFSMKFLKWGPEKSNLGRDLESERPLMLHQPKRTLGPLGHMQHKSYVYGKTHTNTR